MEIEEMLYEAETFRHDGEFDEAVYLYLEIDNLIKTNQKLEYQYASKLYRELCYCYRKMGKIDAAIEMGKQSVHSALKTCMKSDQKKESRISLAYCYMNLGVVYDENGQYKEAVEYYQQGAGIFKQYMYEDAAKKNAYINAILSIGTSLYFMAQYMESRECFQNMIDCMGNSASDSRYNYAMEYLNMINKKTGDETR